MTRFLAWGGRALVRSIILGFLLLAMLAGGLWVFSCFLGPLGGFSLGQDTSLRITRGMAEVDHFYEFNIAPAVTDAQWHVTAVGRGWTAPPRPARWGMTGVHFTSGHVSGMSGPDRPLMVSPARYWLLRIPLWPMILPGMIAGAFLFIRWTRRRRVHQRGFAVEMVPLAQRR